MVELIAKKQGHEIAVISILVTLAVFVCFYFVSVAAYEKNAGV